MNRNKIIIIFAVVIAGTIMLGGYLWDKNNRSVISDNKPIVEKGLSQKQEKFKDLIVNKLYAGKYAPSSIDTSSWKEFKLDSYGFSFRFPSHVKVELVNEDFEEGARSIACIKENEHHQSEDCDIEFMVYDQEGESDFFEGMDESVQFLKMSPDDRKGDYFQFLSIGNKPSLYIDGISQQTIFYNSKDVLVLLATGNSTNFFRDVSDDEIIKGVIQSIEIQ